MIIYIDSLLQEINILNWYQGESAKRYDDNADKVQTCQDQQDALLFHLRSVVVDILQFANPNRVKFTCEYKDDSLVFSLSPLREGREYMLDILKEAIRQYLIYEIRRLWLMNVKPDMADASLRETLRENIRKGINDVTAIGNKVRRRYAPLGI